MSLRQHLAAAGRSLLRTRVHLHGADEGGRLHRHPERLAVLAGPISPRHHARALLHVPRANLDPDRHPLPNGGLTLNVLHHMCAI